jgi:hypothetical protein
VLAMLEGSKDSVSLAFLKKELENAVETSHWISRQIFEIKAKDHRDPFRKATFRNNAEMEQVLGYAGNDSFVKLARQESQRFQEMIGRVTERLQFADNDV